MSDSKDYVSRSDELGNIHISEEVLAAISAAAALEAEGVSSLANPSKKNAARGVHIKLEEEQVVVTMAVLMAYGHTIPEMGRAVQEAVKNAIESMTGLEVAAVNVSVAGIVFPQPEQQ
ncbi:MAG: Asp23/Gls24 family envelope stress response protein [Lawsonibacter sp.]|nr:Asp23/Gls24 family envelope stress response protein [Lawsonibacter sp.]